MDFIPAFAQPFPIKTLCAFLGWPSETWENLRGWTHGNQEVAFSQNKEAGAALAREFTGYVMAALRIRREAAGAAGAVGAERRCDDLDGSARRGALG